MYVRLKEYKCSSETLKKEVTEHKTKARQKLKSITEDG